MQIYTSYFKSKLISGSGLVAVRISLGAPRWQLHYPLQESCPLLMPTRDMLELDEEPFREQYLQLLEDRGAEPIGADLADLAERHGGRGLVLLCLCNINPGARPGSWCHRRLAASWLYTSLGLRVAELGGGGGGSGQQGR